MSLEVDGPNHILEDQLLEKFVGSWKITGKVMKKDVDQHCEIKWVLNHQFLEIHFKDTSRKKVKGDHVPYEALVFIGYDNMSERYVSHWLDIFGGRFSETLGFGLRKNPDSIRFVFEGGEGPLHNTITANKDGTFSMLIEQKNQKGQWTLFADERSQRKTS